MEKHAPGLPGAPLHTAKVMMVDDDPWMIDVVQAHLEDVGFRDFVATDKPREALELLRRERPLVVLLDLMMPEMSGFEVLEAIRSDPEFAYLPVIVLTAEQGAAAKLRALQLGATDFLAKPVDESELVLRVRNTLAYQAYHDQLIHFDVVTGLPNARWFDRNVEECLGRQAGDAILALFSIAVPECRTLRESIDQATADAFAKLIAARLERFSTGHGSTAGAVQAFERRPRVARLSDDRFGLLVDGLHGAEQVEELAKAVVAAVAEPVTMAMHEVMPTPCLGIAMAPGDGRTAEELLKGAGLAAEHARQRGTARFAFASAELNTRSYQRMTLGLQLHGAAQRGELRVHYQPKVDIGSQAIIGAEALVRWQHPDLGLLPPGRFIPLAEELGLVDGIGAWVLAQACRDCADWSRWGLGELSIAVNVSKPQFVTGDLLNTVRRILSSTGLPARQLVLELTESMFMDDVQNRRVMIEELKALGLWLSIDDFGTGYSSLSYLKNLPVDELKIDRSFVVDLPGGRADLSIVQSVIDLGHRLGMSVTAEGVEHGNQLACLQAIGCDTYQGFLFSKPVPAPQFVELLQRPPVLRTGGHRNPSRFGALADA